MSNIKRLIKDTFLFQKKIEDLSALAKINLEKIQIHFDFAKIMEMEAEAETEGDYNLVAKKTERVLIEYFPAKLEKKLNPEIFNEIINKTYTIVDIEAMKVLLRSHGVNPKAFKKLIRVDQSVNRPELKRLYDEKEIKRSDIEGCYSATVSKSIKITRKKDG